MKQNSTYNTIAEMSNGIILSDFQKTEDVRESYQTEAELENSMLKNLEDLGYIKENFKTHNDLMKNLKVQLEKLNKIVFSDDEWQRFLDEYLNPLSDGVIDKTRKIQVDYIYDFTFDNGTMKNIKLIDKQKLFNNTLQVINQFEQEGKSKNRYDVTILINGLPLIHIELKRRGVSLAEAFNQINRYTSESFNTDNSLFKFVQIFVISNGTYTKYFANTVLKNRRNFEFTCDWADLKNKTIDDLVDFTKTFFEKRVILEVLTKYCVFTAEEELLIMRPYQIAATEKIIFKINSSYKNGNWSNPSSGGYIWHTTGSGKTLTSFKAARLATKLDFIDKVFFVVDRKDLDYQTMKEYQKFQRDSVNGTGDTKALKQSIESDDGKIIVTTIQKLNHFIKANDNHEIYHKHCVLIFDECHRSQFGKIQEQIKKKFKKYYQFGFTGTPIFSENAVKGETTANIFGVNLHSYVITDAIRDNKVLKFKVDYQNVKPQFKDTEENIWSESDRKKLVKAEKHFLLHEERIEAITKHILKVFNKKTHRNTYYKKNNKLKYGFNSMFAVQSINAAKLYYEEFQKQQEHLPENKKLKIATIFSFAANEENSAIGEIIDESFETTDFKGTSKDFLNKVICEYNDSFKTNYSTESKSFQNYYKDLSKRVKEKEVDILIVVGMFLTGFDAPMLNTLFVDKNLRYHGLIQAYSRTNRILNKNKAFGNIICFRDLEQATIEAIKTFGKENDVNVLLEKSYKDYIQGFTEEETGEKIKGYKDLCTELLEKFPNPLEIVLEADKKEFCRLFGEILKTENVLKNYDEFEDFEPVISVPLMQDMKSVYVGINEERIRIRNQEKQETDIDYDDIEFQIELLKTDEINLDYILAIILEKSKDTEDTELFKDDIRRMIRSSVGTRAKEDLIITFVDNVNLSELRTNEEIAKKFYEYAKAEKEKAVAKVIAEEDLQQGAKRYIEKSIKKGYASAFGDDLDKILPNLSRRGGVRKAKKEKVVNKIQDIVNVYVEI